MKKLLPLFCIIFSQMAFGINENASDNATAIQVNKDNLKLTTKLIENLYSTVSSELNLETMNSSTLNGDGDINLGVITGTGDIVQDHDEVKKAIERLNDQATINRNSGGSSTVSSNTNLPGYAAAYATTPVFDYYKTNRGDGATMNLRGWYRWLYIHQEVVPDEDGDGVDETYDYPWIMISYTLQGYSDGPTVAEIYPPAQLFTIGHPLPRIKR